MEDWQIEKLKVVKIDANNSKVEDNDFDDTEQPCPWQKLDNCHGIIGCADQDTCVWGYWKRQDD